MSLPESQKKSFRLLGQAESQYPETPTATILETFSNRSPQRNYWITFACPEFTSMCPVTGQPDFASISIRYIPDQLCIETKSLKFYLASYRNARSFNEEITNQILEDLVKVCAPRSMVVKGDFSPRGGISVSVEASFPNSA